MNIKFWGVRGSIPTPGPETVHYGGNTACVEVRTAEGQLFIFDAGTGIRNLGRALMAGEFGQGRGSTHLFISHTHWDHIQGFPFFTPFFVKGNSVAVHGLGSSEKSLKGLISRQMKYCYFPVLLERLAAHIKFVPLKRQMSLMIHGVTLSTRLLNHPGGSLAYRCQENGRVFIYATDAEPYRSSILPIMQAKEKEQANPDRFHQRIERHIQLLENELVEFFRDADVLVYDSQYLATEYPRFVGFGHSSADHAVDLALAAGVKRLVLFHHDPGHGDAVVERMVREATERATAAGRPGLQVSAAREGLEIGI